MPTVPGRRIFPFQQRYFSYPVEGQERQKLPLLHVRLIGSLRVRTVALVDSGATVTFIPPELSEAVGFRVLERDVEAEGAGGEFLNNICQFRLEVLRKGEVQALLQGKAHVPQDEGRIPFVVLGRDHLFAAYDIEFRENQERLVLKNARESN